jgi:hypothetical protein
MHWENNPTLLSIMNIVGFILISSWVCSQFFFFERAILIGPSSIFLEHLFAPICSPMAHLFSLYTCESWTLGKPYCIILNCYWEHLGEHFVNLMVSPWDQGMFFFKSLPSLPPKERNWMPHECMLNLLIGYMKFLFFQNYLSPFLA